MSTYPSQPINWVKYEKLGSGKSTYHLSTVTHITVRPILLSVSSILPVPIAEMLNICGTQVLCSVVKQRLQNKESKFTNSELQHLDFESEILSCHELVQSCTIALFVTHSALYADLQTYIPAQNYNLLPKSGTAQAYLSRPTFKSGTAWAVPRR